MAQGRFNLTKRILLQTTRQVTKKSGAAPMKSILSVTATQAMSLMTGSELNANSKSSLCSLKTGIAFSRSVTPAPGTEIDIRRMENYTVNTLAVPQTSPNEPSPISEAHKMQLANSGSGPSP